jgi:predicted dehydrogenase
MSKLKLATIGAYGHFPHVLEELEGSDDLDVVALAKALPDDDLDAVRKFPIAGIAPAYDDYHLMLREQNPDVVVVSTRLDLINPIAIAAAEAGCHLICEKPLALAHAPLEKLYRTIEGRGVQCIAMLSNPYHAVIRGARQLATEGRFGKIVIVNARKSYKWGSRPDWFGNREQYGNTIGWVGIHALDMIQAVTGERFTSVAAMLSNISHPERPDCQDNVAMILGLSGGGHATVSVDLLRPNAAATHGDDWLRIVGSKGVAEASLDGGWLHVTTNAEAERRVTLPPTQTYYSDFLRSLKRAPAEPLSDTRRAFELTHVCLTAWDAAVEGRVLNIQPGPWSAPPAGTST